MVRVMNLLTGEVQIFSCEPALAVVAADEQSRGNFNTWTYDKSRARVSKTGKTISCGNFGTVLKKCREQYPKAA